MLIRVTTTQADIPRTGEGIAFVHGEIQPKISAMDGNRGFALAVDHASRRYVGVAAWTDPEALEAGGREAPVLIAELARRLHGTTPSVEVFDLVLAHVVKPVRIGYWGRLERLDVPVEDFSEAVRKFEQLVLALFERCDGLAAIVLFADRTAGVIENIIWYDGVYTLRDGAARARELRKLLADDVPTVRFAEPAELDVVIAEMQTLS